MDKINIEVNVVNLLMNLVSFTRFKLTITLVKDILDISL